MIYLVFLQFKRLKMPLKGKFILSNLHYQIELKIRVSYLIKKGKEETGFMTAQLIIPAMNGLITKVKLQLLQIKKLPQKITAA